MTDREVMKLALEALEIGHDGYEADVKKIAAAIAALQAALAEPPAVESKAEMSWRDAHALVTAPTEPPAVPVAWMDQFGNVYPLMASQPDDKPLPWPEAHRRNWKPLYTHPPRTEPTGLANLNVAKLIDIADKKGMDLS